MENILEHAYEYSTLIRGDQLFHLTETCGERNV